MDTAPRIVKGEVTVMEVCTPEDSNVTYELAVLEELQTVFSPEMAHASYIPFYCLIGKTHISYQTQHMAYLPRTLIWVFGLLTIVVVFKSPTISILYCFLYQNQLRLQCYFVSNSLDML